MNKAINMKTIKFLATLAVSALMASCTLDIERPQIADVEDFVYPVLNEMGDVISDANTTGVEQVVFTWSPADFGAATQVQYSVFAKLNDKTALVGQSYSTYLTIAKGDLVGTVVNELGGNKNETVAIQTYVEAVINGTNSEPLVSNEVGFSVFTYLPAKKNIWLPGAYQGWAQFGTTVWEYAAGTSQYKFLVNVSDGSAGPFYFKVVDEGGNWVGMNDGYKAKDWEVADAADKDGNFSVKADEPIIWLTIDTKKKEVYKETVTKVGLIGGFNGWSEADEPSFTYNTTDNVWESPVVSFDGSSGWLVRLNKTWDYKYGGAVASTEIEGGFELSQGGSDIPSPEAGSYIVKLHTNRTPFVIEYVKQ